MREFILFSAFLELGAMMDIIITILLRIVGYAEVNMNARDQRDAM